MAYRTGPRAAGGTTSQLTWLDRAGKPLGVVGNRDVYDAIALSPDGTRAAVVLAALSDAGLGNVDIWVVDLARGVPYRLTTEPTVERAPLWSPTGDRLAFSSVRGGIADLYVRPSSGSGEDALLAKSTQGKSPTGWSRDGRFLLLTSNDPTTAADIWLLPLGGDRTPVPLIQTPFAEDEASFSPDMRWIAYTSNRSGRSEIYVQPFDRAAPGSTAGAATLISKDGGQRARWRQDGREIVFQAPDGAIMAVDLTYDGAIHPGTPTPLFTPAGPYWDVTADARRFLVTVPPAEAGRSPITVMLNWK